MGQVYIFDFGSKIKVGYSTDVKKRLRTIELSSGIEAKQVYAVEAERTVEKIVHSKLENRLIGEFFDFPFDQAKSILDKIVEEYLPSISNPVGGTKMVSEKIKALLALSGKKQGELADYFGMTKQSMNNKMSRDSWSTKDLVMVANFTGCELAFLLPGGQHLIIENDTPTQE